MSLVALCFRLTKCHFVNPLYSCSVTCKTTSLPFSPLFLISVNRTYFSSLVVCHGKCIKIVQNHSNFSLLALSSRSRTLATEAKNSSTQGEKDIILFKYENQRYYQLLNLFGYVMWCLGMVTALEFFSMEVTSKSQDEKELPWFAIRFQSDLTKYLFTGLTGFVGCGCLAICWAYSLRSVSYLVLRKGRKQVTIVTHNPAIFYRHMMYTADVSDVSCQGSRGKSDLLPLKVKGKWFHFLLPKGGTYINPDIFDKTIGVNRGF